ncbi:MAG: glycosyltransferase family 2 protein [Anaerolineae bacterium]|nr:glycosyltransferase family 2 protein [Anaerolineae bacterium]
MTLLLIVAAVALSIIALVAVLNALMFPRLKAQPVRGTPRVSILIPARNEAAVIGDTVRALLKQTYAHFELIVLDDASSDATGALARAAGADDPRLKVISGVPLPPGWTGKNHACHVLAQHATGEILLFTDADTRWQPAALAALLALLESSQADLVTVWPTQHTETAAERLVVPLMMLAIIGYLPLVMTHYTPFAIFAAANGQCMAWRRAAYARVGGHASVAASVLDDVHLARLAKQRGLRLRMADGAGLIGCRMYTGWPGVRDGFAKNILAGYGNSVLALLAGTLFHWLIFWLPWLWLLLPETRLWGLLLILPGIGVRALSAAVSRQRVLDALFMPLSVFLMTLIAARAIRWHYTGGPRWKGRTLPQNSIHGAAHGS